MQTSSEKLDLAEKKGREGENKGKGEPVALGKMVRPGVY